MKHNELVYRFRHDKNRFITFEDGISCDSDEVYYGLYYHPGDELIGIMGNYVQMDSCQQKTGYKPGSGLKHWYDEPDWCLNKMRETIKREFGGLLEECLFASKEENECIVRDNMYELLLEHDKACRHFDDMIANHDKRLRHIESKYIFGEK